MRQLEGKAGTSARVLRWWLMGLVALVTGLGVSAPDRLLSAVGFKPPDNCLAYTDDHFLQCLYAMIEMQGATIAQLREQVKTQAATIEQLQAESQSRATQAEHLQQEIDQRNQQVQNLQMQPRVVPFYGSMYNPFYGPPMIGPCGGVLSPC